MRVTLLLSVLAVGLGGCGDHGVPPGGDDMAMPSDDMSAVVDMMIPNDAKQIVTFSMFAQDFAQALCARYMRCGQLDAAQMSACIENNLRHTGWDQDVEIMKNRVEINELQCIAAIGNSRCDNSDEAAWITRCFQFLYTGHVANGGACIADVECTSGFCQHAGSDAGIPEQVTGCPGTCANPKPIGATCRLVTDCDATSFCDPATNQCAKLAASGEACTNLFLGTGSGPSCQTGLLCPAFPTGASPTCVTPTMQTLGQKCDPFQGASTATPGCAAGTYCQLQYTATATTCTVATQATDCPLAGAYCDPTSLKCQNLTGGKCATKISATMACDPNNDGMSSFINNQCADGSVCAKLGAQTSFTCQTLGSANATCASDVNCKVGLYCNASNKCTPWFSDGQVCDVSGHCPSETQQNVCIADNADAGAVTTCQPTKNAGAPCIPGFEDSLCEPSDLPSIQGMPGSGSTYCAPNGTGGGTCAPKCF